MESDLPLIRAASTSGSSTITSTHPTSEKGAVEASTGSTRQRIGLTELKQLPVAAPALPAQVAIATVLSDMDAELAALEQRLAKTRALSRA